MIQMVKRSKGILDISYFKSWVAKTKKKTDYTKTPIQFTNPISSKDYSGLYSGVSCLEIAKNLSCAASVQSSLYNAQG